MTQLRFPKGFIWGTATSAQQIEGAFASGGRGESIWDRFAQEKGRIADGSDSRVACDHYHRWAEDIALMKGLGLGAYRFSISWPRIFPNGTGQPNAKGLDFYDTLVDHLLEAGITPYPTLYHWDLPQALQDRGGWADRSIVDAFAEYSVAVTRRLGDRVKDWVTHNEPWCIATLGHEEGCHAPGHKDPAEALRVNHHLMLSHGRAARAIYQEVKDAQVGLVNIQCPAYPHGDSEGDRDAARWFDGFFNRWFMDPVFLGRYPEDAIADRVQRGHLSSPDLPFVKDGDMQEIATGKDFLGMNYYSRSVMKQNAKGQPEAVQVAADEELTDMGWEVYPAGLTKALVEVQKVYNPPRIYITENGAAYDVPQGEDGCIRDQKRISYLQQHLMAVHKAIEAGVPVAGYFAWSLLDNFEWALGYEKKFGLYGLDPQTLDRIPKDSADWYREVIANHGVDDSLPSSNQGENRVHPE